MFNKKFMLIAIFLVSILAISAVSANEINSTDEIAINENTIDEISVSDMQSGEDSEDCAGISDEDCINANEGTFTDLQNLINGASQPNILLEKDYVYDEGFDIEGIEIRESLTIDGNGHTVDALGKSRIFNIKDKHVTLNNIIFRNGKAVGNGGAVSFPTYGVDKDIVVNCTFINNYASLRYVEESDYYTDGCGGAIYNGNAVNCTFINNRAEDCGGAIYDTYYTDYFCNVQNCTFINNSIVQYNKKSNYFTHAEGGAIYGCNVVNCRFVNNFAFAQYEEEDDYYDGGYGGAIYDANNVVDCSFNNNSANSGGAIFRCANVENCIFVNNSALAILRADEDGTSVYGSRGGAIYKGDNILNCRFVNNSAKSGGAIYDGHVRDSNFVNNHADDCGGAIYTNDEDYDEDVVNCTFLNNSAYSGGAVYSTYYYDYDDRYGYDGIFSGYRCEIINSSFADNSAMYGGAIYNADEVTDCTFVDNRAVYSGGAIHDANEVVGCSFSNNSASGMYYEVKGGFYDGGEGGAISRANKIVNCTFTDNSAVNNIIISFDSLDSYLSNRVPKYVADYELNRNYDSHVENKKIKGLSGCDIPEEAINNYGDIELIGSELIIKSLRSESYDELYVDVSGEDYAPYFNKRNNVYDAHFKLNDLSEGSYYAHIYLLNSTYVSRIRTYYDNIVDVTIPIIIKTKYDISSSDMIKYYGGDEKYSVVLTKNNDPLADANVKITVNGKTQTVKTDSKGQATIDLDLPVGTYDVTAVYGEVSKTSKVTVKSTIATADAAGEYLNSKVSATFLNTNGKALASKQVTFKINGKEYAATADAKGVATATVDLGAGNYKVTAVHPVSKEQKQFNLVISKAGSKIALTSAQNNGGATLTAALAPASATGGVVFNVSGENKNAQISNGKATLTLKNLEPGNYTVTASYSGDKNLNASTSNTVSFSIAEVYPILTAEGLTKTYGNVDKFVVNLIDSKGNAIANAVVNVDIKGKVTPITTGSDGQATMPITLAPAEYTATVTYADMQTTAKITVKKATPKMTAKAKAFKKSVKTKKYTVTLKTNKNKVMKNKKVTLKVNKKTYSAKTNSKGVATFKITKLIKKGKYTATVAYSGSSYYNKLTKKVKITVK